MLKKLKLYSLKKQTDKILSERDISQRNSTLNFLGFLIDENSFDNFEKLYEWGIEFGLQRKDVKQFTFVKGKRSFPSSRENQITDKEFDWKGGIRNENAQEFLNYPFDVIIGYYNGRHEFLDAMMARSKAKFKIGFNGANEQIFDLLLTADLQKPEILKEQLVKYLKILKKI